MKVIKIISNTIRNILTVIAVCILLTVAVCAILQLKPCVVLSGSMEPAIQTGSFVLIDKKDKDVEIGDIVAYNHQNMQILHRVVRTIEDGYITKGDNNETEDYYIVSPASIIGTLEVDIPKAGYFIKWATSLQGLIIIISFCICLIMTGFLTSKEESGE